MSQSLWDRILDTSILFSFDRSGYNRHKKFFENEQFAGDPKNILITGGNSGIGFAAAESLADRGHTIHLLCRDRSRGNEALSKLSGNGHTLHIADLSSVESVNAWLQSFQTPIDVLILNAGSMPRTLKITSAGFDEIFTIQVLSHTLILNTLLKHHLLKPSARVIWVSSGGMYAQKLNLDDIQWKNAKYNPYSSYANAKRIQVILNEMTAHRLKKDGITTASMHPGWVDTPAIQRYLPWFRWWLQRRLRTPKEGADTIVWLALTTKNYPTGKFWFDRKEAPTHLMKMTHETDVKRKEMLQLLKTQIHDFVFMPES